MSNQQPDATMQSLFGNRISNIRFRKSYFLCDEYRRLFLHRNIYLYVPTVKCEKISATELLVRNIPYIDQLNQLTDILVRDVVGFSGSIKYFPENGNVIFKIGPDTCIHGRNSIESGQYNIVLQVTGLHVDYTCICSPLCVKLDIHIQNIIGAHIHKTIPPLDLLCKYTMYQ